LGYVPPDKEFPYRFRQGGRNYRLDRLPLETGSMVLYNQVDMTDFAVDNRQILYTVLGAVLMSLFAAIGLGLVLSINFTRPIQILISRIHKIYEENDFSYDPEIENRKDEIGRIGKAVNEMSGNIGRFLVRTEEHYREQKNSQIALLQTQLNPHFLYNTLDSIQLMAKLQNNPAIADFARRLINLLRSIPSKMEPGGTAAKITLAEELRILEDYSEVMSVRFMGSFEVVNKIPEAFLNCRIPKLTLQPLLENALLHGMDPSGKFIVITLTATEEGDYLHIIVEDNGVGISPEQMETIKTRYHEKGRNHPSLNNIGIINVDKQLRLLYGESCGLFFESRLGEYTRVTVKILKDLQSTQR
jgi:two-component system sensor histidine kinase YesM